MKTRKAGKPQTWQAEVPERKGKDKLMDGNC
jgi:hypothetical protein